MGCNGRRHSPQDSGLLRSAKARFPSAKTPRQGPRSRVAAERAIDEVCGDGQVRDLRYRCPARQPGEVVASHDQLHGAARHLKVPPVHRLRVDPSWLRRCVARPGWMSTMMSASIAWRTERSDGGRRRLSSSPIPTPPPRGQATFTGQPSAAKRGDDLEAPLGSVCSLSSSQVRLVIASSVSSSRIRLRATTRSADSAVVVPRVAAPDPPGPGWPSRQSSNP